MILTENNALAENILTKHYYNEFKKGRKTLEIFLLGTCRNNCQYCYLKKHPELYPNKIDYNTIYKNVDLILKWYIKNQFTNTIDIFSGEWLTIPAFRDKIFEIFYDNFSKTDVLHRPGLILVPDNMNFIDNDDDILAVQTFINIMKELGITFCISASLDGLPCEEERNPMSNEKYERIFTFLNFNHFGYHAMISSSNIYNQIENYIWWKNTAGDYLNSISNFLEVRDNNWDEQSISAYIQYLDYVITDKYNNQFNKNKVSFLKHVLGIEDRRLLQPYCIQLKNPTENKLTCNYVNALSIRAMDLGVGLCHRLSYPEILLGKYVIENDEISYFDVENVELLIMKEHTDMASLPHCENCQFLYMCLGHCAGASYEAYMNPLIPPRTVCNLFYAKYTYLIIKYQELGLWDCLKYVMDTDDIKYKYFTDLINNVLEGAINKGIYFPKEATND